MASRNHVSASGPRTSISGVLGLWTAVMIAWAALAGSPGWWASSVGSSLRRAAPGAAWSPVASRASGWGGLLVVGEAAGSTAPTAVATRLGFLSPHAGR